MNGKKGIGSMLILKDNFTLFALKPIFSTLTSICKCKGSICFFVQGATTASKPSQIKVLEVQNP